MPPSARSTPTRRACLAGFLGLTFGPLPRCAADEPAPDEAIRKELLRVGLKDVGSTETEHFVAVGDAPAGFREDALRLCEALASTLHDHFQAKSLPAELPRGRLPVVVLASRKSYAAYAGEEVDDAEGGHYDLATNRLVMFDFLKNARANTFTLVHEAVHQWTYNAGLLSREGDVPTIVSEGLAAYAELWQKKNPRVGQVNPFRLNVFRDSRNPPEWIPIEELLVRDEAFEDPRREQVAYTEAWLLMHEWMTKSPSKLKTYLAATRARTDMARRSADARDAFGDLGRIDRELRKKALRLLES